MGLPAENLRSIREGSDHDSQRLSLGEQRLAAQTQAAKNQQGNQKGLVEINVNHWLQYWISRSGRDERIDGPKSLEKLKVSPAYTLVVSEVLKNMVSLVGKTEIKVGTQLLEDHFLEREHFRQVTERLRDAIFYKKYFLGINADAILNLTDNIDALRPVDIPKLFWTGDPNIITNIEALRRNAVHPANANSARYVEGEKKMLTGMKIARRVASLARYSASRAADVNPNVTGKFRTAFLIASEAAALEVASFPAPDPELNIIIPDALTPKGDAIAFFRATGTTRPLRFADLLKPRTDEVRALR